MSSGKYRNNLTNRFLAASALPQNPCLHSRLAQGQWSLNPDKNSEEPLGQNSDSSGCFGILIAADRHCEWLLSWFFESYSTCNTHPLAIVDMGMSHGALTFCAQRAEVIPLQMDRVPPLSIQSQGWYKKPFAFLQTPFDRTLWLDCDCEVLKPLDPLFELEGDIVLAPDTENSHLKEQSLGTIQEGEVLYNSGVVLYNKGSSLIEAWAERVLDQDRAFFSDQHVLSKLIQDVSCPVETLPDLYNWRMSQGLNIHAAIIHWVGTWGKEYIRKHGGLAHELAALPII